MPITNLDALLERLTLEERARFNDMRHEFATDRDCLFNALNLRGYLRLIYELDPTVNPLGVESSMRLLYGTLNHLPRRIFLEEILIAKQCEAEEPGFLRGAAASYGAAHDFDQAQRLVQHPPPDPIVRSTR